VNGGILTPFQSRESSPRHSIREYEHGYEEEQRLRGFRSACGFVTATWGLRCPRCGQLDLTEFPLSGKGVVAAYTVQNVPADEFVNDAPYAYVVVDLDEGGRVSGWMPSVRGVDDLSIGDRVHWVPSYKPGVQFQKETGTPLSAGR
jgi:uncharacterized OB-fold protein